MAETRIQKTRTASIVGGPAGSGNAHPLQGSRITGAKAVVAALEAEGVEVLFGYPGSQALKIYDALYDSKCIRHVLARHEQGAVHEADGYARATGKVGVALVTSGPGATNTVTGIATAYMDSSPLVIITGQVPRSLIGTDSFQESDIVGISMPVVKHSYLIQDANKIAVTIREAFHIAKTGRPGPVLIDIPSDLLGNEVLFDFPDSVNIPSYRPTYKGNARQIRAAAEKISLSNRPVLLVGGGVIAAGAGEYVSQLAKDLNIPIVHTLMGKGAVSTHHPCNFGLAGMHGSMYANLALNRSDLIVACGVRFSDRVTGHIETFAPHADLIHIDIDPAEIGKVLEATIPIVGDLRNVLANLLACCKEIEAKPADRTWLEQIGQWRERHPLYRENIGGSYGTIAPEIALEKLSDAITDADPIVLTDVGQHQMWAAQAMACNKPRSFITPGGLGTMGFGLPAAIGAALGYPDKMVICISGDGSLQMNIQEMATATCEDAHVKVVLIDNGALGMVRQWQRIFYDERYSATEFKNNPDFCKLAEAYGWGSSLVENPEQLESAFAEMLDFDGPYLLNIRIAPNQSVFPMADPGRGMTEALGVIDNERDGLRILEAEEDVAYVRKGASNA